MSWLEVGSLLVALSALAIACRASIAARMALSEAASASARTTDVVSHTGAELARLRERLAALEGGK